MRKKAVKKAPSLKDISLDEFKELVKWAKKEKIAHFQFKDFTVSFSPLALVEDDQLLKEDQILGRDLQKKEKTAEELAQEEEALLYHSSNS